MAAAPALTAASSLGHRLLIILHLLQLHHKRLVDLLHLPILRVALSKFLLIQLRVVPSVLTSSIFH